MQEKKPTVDLADAWPEEFADALFDSRDRIVQGIRAGEETSRDVTWLKVDELGLIATLTLVRDGYVDIDSDDPSKLVLTDDGKNFAYFCELNPALKRS